MLGKDRHDCIVFSEKQDSGQRNPFLLCLLICQNQSRTAKHFLISMEHHGWLPDRIRAISLARSIKSERSEFISNRVTLFTK